MTDHPGTFSGQTEPAGGANWDDRASLHERGDGGGIFSGAKALRRGSLAEMVRHVMLLPEEYRRKYVIQKSGDHIITQPEIEALAARSDFPKLDSSKDPT